MSIAVLITSFNRIKHTRECLTALNNHLNDFTVYLVDDNSIDGTPEMVKKCFPQVKLISGNGNLYWSRGMRRAWMEAMKENHEYYLWLNDDVEIYDGFFEELLWCLKYIDENGIVSGLIEDSSLNIIYGGSTKEKELIKASEFPRDIYFMNGNVVLVPNKIISQVGIIDSVFHHDLGDVDYGLRVLKKGYKVVTTRFPIGRGMANPVSRVRKSKTTIYQRFKHLYSPLGSPPHINFYFRFKHFGILNAFTYVVYLHLLNVLSDKATEIFQQQIHKYLRG